MWEGVLETLRPLTAPSRAAWSALALARFPSTLWSTGPCRRQDPGVETRGLEGQSQLQPHMAATSTHTGRTAQGHRLQASRPAGCDRGRSEGRGLASSTLTPTRAGPEAHSGQVLGVVWNPWFFLAIHCAA